MDEKWFAFCIVTFSLATTLYYHPIILVLSVTSLAFIGHYWKKTMTSNITSSGKWIFVTGCDSGIGNKLVVSLDEKGCYVIAACRDIAGPGAKSLAESCSERLHIVSLELTSPESIEQCIQTVWKLTEKTRLWGIVNNAGMQYKNYAELLTMDMYRRCMDVNFMGTVSFCKALIPLLRKSKGRIVNVTSVLGRITTDHKAVYTASKWAGESFTDTLRRDMKRFGIRVSIIEPGGYGRYTHICQRDIELRNNQEMLRHATREVIDAYGEDQVANMAIKVFDKSKYPDSNLSRVTRQIEHALFNTHPDSRYLVDSPGLDKYCWLARIAPLLPDILMDFSLHFFNVL